MTETLKTPAERRLPELSHLVKTLADALQFASEHLQYCGYGDSWDRACAMDGSYGPEGMSLPDTIEEALEKARRAGWSKP